MLPGGEMLERLACLLEGKHAVDDRMDTVEGEGAAHVLEVLAAANPDRPQRRLAQEEVDQAHPVEGRVEHADQRDLAGGGDRLDRLRDGAGAADLDDAVDAATVGKGQYLGRPSGGLNVVDHRICPELQDPAGL